MPEYKININKNEIMFDGISFKIDELKFLLKKHDAELFTTITCPGKIEYILTDEAKMFMRQKREEEDAAG